MLRPALKAGANGLACSPAAPTDSAVTRGYVCSGLVDMVGEAGQAGAGVRTRSVFKGCVGGWHLGLWTIRD